MVTVTAEAAVLNNNSTWESHRFTFDVKSDDAENQDVAAANIRTIVTANPELYPNCISVHFLKFVTEEDEEETTHYSFDEAIEKAGWNTDTCVSILTRYIEEECSMEEFETWLNQEYGAELEDEEEEE